jgi:hypothetical protein
MLKLGEEHKALHASDFSRDIPITEYEPKKPKWPSPELRAPAKNKLPKCFATTLGLKLPKTRFNHWITAAVAISSTQEKLKKVIQVGMLL